jgi:serine/threonine protein kinase
VECLHILHKPGREFDAVGRFIDSFCASGSALIKFEKSLPNSDGLVKLKFTRQIGHDVAVHANFIRHREKSWLYVSQRRRDDEDSFASYESRVHEAERLVQEYDAQVAQMPTAHIAAATIEERLKIQSLFHDIRKRLTDSLERCRLFPFVDMTRSCYIPDYLVHPPSPSARMFFLPLNVFASEFGHHEPTGMLDAERLELINQGTWFTVFRYKTSSSRDMIIKHTNVNNASFKYLLQEKAMLQYLRSSKFIAGQIAKLNITPIVTFDQSGTVIQNDRFIVYEDAGLPLDSAVKRGWAPDVSEIRQFAKCLLEALDYLRKSNVVHRNIHMNSVVWIKSVPTVKLISLGHARYTAPLPFDHQLRAFLDRFRPPSSADLAPPLHHSSPLDNSPISAEQAEDFVDSDDGLPAVGSVGLKKQRGEGAASDDDDSAVGDSGSSSAKCGCIAAHAAKLKR